MSKTLARQSSHSLFTIAESLIGSSNTKKQKEGVNDFCSEHLKQIRVLEMFMEAEVVSMVHVRELLKLYAEIVEYYSERLDDKYLIYKEKMQELMGRSNVVQAMNKSLEKDYNKKTHRRRISRTPAQERKPPAERPPVEEFYKEDVQKMLATHENDSKIIQKTIQQELTCQTDLIKQRLALRKSSSVRTLQTIQVQPPSRKRVINIDIDLVNSEQIECDRPSGAVTMKNSPKKFGSSCSCCKTCSMSTKNSERTKFHFPKVNEVEEELEKEKEMGNKKFDEWLQDFVTKVKVEREEKLVSLSEKYESQIKDLEEKISLDSGSKLLTKMLDRVKVEKERKVSELDVQMKAKIQEEISFLQEKLKYLSGNI